MRRRLAVAGIVAVAPLVAQAAPPLQVTVDGVPTSVWLQQPFEVVVRVAYDAAWFAASSVPLFQQAVDLPCHLVVPWLQAAEDRAVELVAPPAGVPTLRVAVGDRLVPLERALPWEHDGRRYEAVLVRCRWLPLARGTLPVAPVQVRYAFATRFEEDFLRGRQPLDRQEATEQSALQQIEVRNLPDGAPTGFTGAVGEFAVAATTGAAAVRVGEAFEVVMEVTGDGNLERFAAPRPFGLDGFHVQGLVERRAVGRRRFALDVVALRQGSTSLPPLPFVAFSPRTASYTTLATAALPLRVEPAAGALSPRLQELVAADARAVARRETWPTAVWAALAVVVVGSSLALRRWRRRREQTGIVAALRVQLQRDDLGPAERLQAFDALVALLTGGSERRGEVGQRLAQQGIAPATIERILTLRAALDAARFGGAVPTSAELFAAVEPLGRG